MLARGNSRQRPEPCAWIRKTRDALLKDKLNGTRPYRLYFRSDRAAIIPQTSAANSCIPHASQSADIMGTGSFAAALTIQIAPPRYIDMAAKLTATASTETHAGLNGKVRVQYSSSSIKD